MTEDLSSVARMWSPELSNPKTVPVLWKTLMVPSIAECMHSLGPRNFTPWYTLYRNLYSPKHTNTTFTQKLEMNQMPINRMDL